MAGNGTVHERLFGTDGIRGTANQYPMTPDMVVKVGQALGHLLQNQKLTLKGL